MEKEELRKIDELVFKKEKHLLECLSVYLQECPELIGSPDLARPVPLAEMLVHFQQSFNPTTNWCLAGPIIQRENINIIKIYGKNKWCAYKHKGSKAYGETPIIAAMVFYTGYKKEK